MRADAKDLDIEMTGSQIFSMAPPLQSGLGFGMIARNRTPTVREGTLEQFNSCHRP